MFLRHDSGHTTKTTHDEKEAEKKKETKNRTKLMRRKFMINLDCFPEVCVCAEDNIEIGGRAADGDWGGVVGHEGWND